MLAIRFARVGKKNKAQFKIVLQDSIVAPGGRHVEILGSYDPHRKQAVIKEERVKYWIGQGAQPSDTVHNLLVSKGIIDAPKRAVKIPAKKVEEIAEVAAQPVEKTEENPKEEAKAEEVKKEEIKEDVKPEEVKASEAPKTEEKKEEAK
jgi:small subunit ribosomal protein S16